MILDSTSPVFYYARDTDSNNDFLSVRDSFVFVQVTKWFWPFKKFDDALITLSTNSKDGLDAKLIFPPWDRSGQWRRSLWGGLCSTVSMSDRTGDNNFEDIRPRKVVKQLFTQFQFSDGWSNLFNKTFNFVDQVVRSATELSLEEGVTWQTMLGRATLVVKKDMHNYDQVGIGFWMYRVHCTNMTLATFTRTNLFWTRLQLKHCVSGLLSGVTGLLLVKRHIHKHCQRHNRPEDWVFLPKSKITNFLKIAWNFG